MTTVRTGEGLPTDLGGQIDTVVTSVHLLTGASVVPIDGLHPPRIGSCWVG